MSKKVNCGSCNGVGLDINLYEHKGNFFCHHGCINAYETRILPLETQLAEKDAYLKEAMEMLDNVIYWESCPEDYKERIHKLTEAKP
jgi:hypothetical protein